MFETWGRFVSRRRWPVLVVSLLVLAAAASGIALGGSTTNGGSSSGTSPLEAERASALINQQLTPAQAAGDTAVRSTFLLILGSATMTATDSAFASAVEAAVAPLRADTRVLEVTTPFSAPPAAAAGMVSRDGHQVLVRVGLRDPGPTAQKYYPQLRSEVRSSTLSITGTGNVPINRAFNGTIENDLTRAEVVSLPATLLLLLLIFATAVAAGLPLAVGILAIVSGVGGTLWMARYTDVSQYAINIVTLIGLALAIDYSLFLVTRFRDELAAGRAREDALAVTVATAGRSITFSGLTVAIGLGSMLFFQGTFLASMGAAGIIVTLAAVFFGMTFLPAFLAILGPRVNRLRLPLGRRRPASRLSWAAIAGWVMRRPALVLVPTVAFLVLAGLPFLTLRLANGGVDQLPPNNESRRGYDQLLANFPGQDQTVITVVADYGSGSPLTTYRIGGLFDLSRRVAAMPHVLRVMSPVDVDPTLSRSDYQRLLGAPPSSLPPPLAAAVQQSVGTHVAVLNVVTNLAPQSDGARDLVRAIRAEGVGDGGAILVTGQTAGDLDVIGYIEQRGLYAGAFVVLVTAAVLFLLTGSVLLPLKAVVVNLLSIGASFGALVWIFQEGHLSGLLHFTAQSIDPTVPVILFSIVFGMSMDYEVFLVSRIQEEYRRTGDNQAAVAAGLQRSGRLITGAAAIMVAVFLAFGLADVLLIKAIGIGLAVAVAIDATIVRALVVPAVMRLLGRWNWWAPGFLTTWHEAVHAVPAPPAVAGAPGVID